VSKGPLASRGYNAHYRYYNADEETKAELTKHNQNFNDYTTTLKNLLEKVDKKVKPFGTLDKPARTCRELFESYKHMQTGTYFIDPNEGAPNDAVLVKCDRDTMETCINTEQETSAEKKNWGNYDDTYKWILGDVKQESEIAYKMPVNQMKLLQSMSSKVRQTFTYHCKNSFALVNDMGVESPFPLKFKTDDQQEETLSINVDNRNLMYKIVHDDCSSKSWVWRNTTIAVESRIPEQLPILDVATHDIGGYDEEFGLEVGPVCFN
jgi:hypothetical protein